jgi:hypothetical protein
LVSQTGDDTHLISQGVKIPPGFVAIQDEAGEGTVRTKTLTKWHMSIKRVGVVGFWSWHCFYGCGMD